MRSRYSNQAEGKTRGRTSRRRGAALIEFVVCLPVIVLLILGSVEMCDAIFLRQSLATAAYEAVREAVHADGSPQQARARANAVLSAREVTGGEIAFSPSNIGLVPRGQFVQVTVTAPYAGNSVLRGQFMSGRSLRSTATMVKE